MADTEHDELEMTDGEAKRGLLQPAPNGSVNDDHIAFSNDVGDQGENGGEHPQTEEVPTSLRVRRKVKESCRKCFSMKTLKRKLPIIQWLPKYRLNHFQCDLIAGLTVGLTVIPQGLAYAVVAGLQPQYGLYSAFMGCFVYMFMGTAKDITLGPTAIMSLLTNTFAASTVENDPTMAIVLTLFCGLIQLAMGLLNLGILVSYISHSVINAFTSAAAITIAVGQIKSILGLKNIPQDFMPMVYYTCKQIPQTKIWDMVMGLVSMVALFALKKLREIKWKDQNDPERPVRLYVRAARKFLWLVGTGANAIVVIVAAGVAAGMLSHNINVFSLTGKITPGIPNFEPPAFSNPSINLTTPVVFEKIGAGFVIVPLLGIVEAIAIGKAFARTNNYKIDATQELISIGVANILSSFVHSYPVTGSFSRTAVNSQSGVKTPAGGLFTGVLILLALQFLVKYCYYIPKSALAAVIIMAVIQMVDYKIVPILWRTNSMLIELLIHLITFVLSFVLGIEYGILIGVGLSLLLLLYPMARPRLQVTQKQGIVIIQLDQGLFFPAVEHVEEKIMKMALEDEKPKAVIVDMSHVFGVDYTAVQTFKSLLADASRHSVRIIFCQIRPRVMKDILKADISKLKTCGTVEEALEELCSQGHELHEEVQPFISRL
ncbi:sodium-independent sulfate anion transporter-like [Pomacea canaliculata]|uniref:sodium-independent sulfate anion transporter-like n=1 Tax=Pomacea canaliculata TaxID=400727 RepID=UPI000D739929|nr:sodium-independent sulfate anion transporter-like [Pomacea canaliculata]